MDHREIKPSNVMLDEAGAIKLLDFGLVMLDRWDGISSELTTIGQFLGTLDYMAPEQAESCGAVDYRADLYSLGATLFRLLCGRAPLAAAPNQSPLEKLRLLANHRPPSLKTLRPDAPADLVRLVDQLLATNPNDRHASAAHVAEQLAPLAEGSNLVALLQESRKSETESPNTSLPASAYPSLLAHQTTLADAGSGKRTYFGWLAAACLPFMAFAGYWIVLETHKGQLVIESEVADVQVKILRNGQPIKDLAIQTGSTSTRLTADQYEITIDSPSDSLAINKDKFTIKNGEIIVARITNKSTTAILLPSPRLRKEVPDGSDGAIKTQPPSSNTNTGEPTKEKSLYKGKTFDQWLAQLRLEKDRKTWEESFEAIHALATPLQKTEMADEAFSLMQRRTNLSNSNLYSSLATWKSPTYFSNKVLQEAKGSTLDNFFNSSLPRIRDSIVVLRLPMEVWNPIWNRLEAILSDTDNMTVGIDGAIHEFFRELVYIPRSSPSAVTSPESLNRAWYVVKAFPKLGKHYLLDKICYAIELSRSARTSRREEVLAWETAKSTELLAYKRGLIEDSNASLQNRISMLELFTPEELNTVETKAIFAEMTSNMLSQAAENPELLFGKLRSDVPNWYPSFLFRMDRIASGTSAKWTNLSQLTSSSKAFASLLYATERIPPSMRPTAGLDSVIQATKETHDLVQSELMKQLGVNNPSLLSFSKGDIQSITVDVGSKKIQFSEDLKKLIDVFFCNRWAVKLRSTTAEIDDANSNNEIRKDAIPAIVNIVTSQIKVNDKNKDLKLSRDEWRESVGDFDATDIDQDGSISAGELYRQIKTRMDSSSHLLQSPNDVSPQGLRGQGLEVKDEKLESRPSLNNPKTDEAKNSQPLYKGKTFDQWQSQLRLEQDKNAWLEAFNAIDDLTNSEEKPKWIDEVFLLAIKHAAISEPSFCLRLASWDSPEVLSKKFLQQLLQQLGSSSPSNDSSFLSQFGTAIVTLPFPFEVWDSIWKHLEEIQFDPDESKHLSDSSIRVLCEILVATNSKDYKVLHPERQIDRAVYILDKFPKFGRKYLLPAFCIKHANRQLSGGSPYEQLLAKTVDSHGTRLLTHKLAVLADDSASLEDRVLILGSLTSDDMNDQATNGIFGVTADKLLILATRDPEKLFADGIVDRPVAFRNLGTDRRRLIETGTGQKVSSVAQLQSNKLYAILLYSLERIPISIRPKEGLNRIIDETKITHDRIRTDLMTQLNVDDLSQTSFLSGFNSQISDNRVRDKSLLLKVKFSIEQEKSLEIYFCHRWANDLRGTPTADSQPK